VALHIATATLSGRKLHYSQEPNPAFVTGVFDPSGLSSAMHSLKPAATLNLTLT